MNDLTKMASDTTLAALVIAHPEVAGRLDELGLDYCCGGQRRVVDAILAAGLDVDDVTAELEALAPKADRSTEPEWVGMDGLVDHLESTHHAYLHDALPTLEALADKVAGVHGANHPELVDVRELVHEIRADLEPHVRKEEQVLFPMIRELTASKSAADVHPGTFVNPIRVMLSEHDKVGDLLAALRAATDAYHVPGDGCASYHALYRGLAELESDTHLHVHKENNELFPMVFEAERTMSAATQ